ncbi:hypothetical protein ES707_04590 [subsurface metagenome]
MANEIDKKELKKYSGIQFEPRLVDIFIKILETEV